MQHPLIGKQFKVLDDGLIRVVDIMGDDSAVVQAARVSYGAGTKQVNEDRGLIRYLMRHRHTSVFEMASIKLHLRVPMDCWRQFVRHRTAKINEYSTRYSVAIDSAQTTYPDQWRAQSAANKQGSGDRLPADVGQQLTHEEAALQEHARAAYERRLAAGVAREQARKDLPLSTYTEAYWKIDLHNLLHFLALRMDKHAQLEIREYANVIGNQIVAEWCPLVWEAFLDYRVNSLTLSSYDLNVIKALISGDKVAANELAGSKSRERSELEAKLARMGMSL